MATKEQIRPLYGELIGFLSQVPKPDNNYETLGEDHLKIIEQLNSTINELNGLTGQDFSKFKVEIKYYPQGGERFASVMELRTNLNGLIMRLYATYFPDENPPFGGSPSMIVNQNQNQSQSQSQIVMLLEFRSLIDSKLNDSNIGKQEKSFLQKVKTVLPGIRSATELFNTVISIAKELGLDINTIHQLLK